MGVGMQGIGLESGRVFEQAIQNIDRFPDPAGHEVAEQGDRRVANMRGGDAAECAVTDMPGTQQSVFEQLDRRAVGNGRLATAPEKRQLEPGRVIDHITQGGFECGGRDVLGIESSSRVPPNEVLGMASGLRGPEFGGIPENGQERARDGIG